MSTNYYLNRLKSILGLSLSLAKADFKLRNEGSYLGIFWYLLDPLTLFIIILAISNSFVNLSNNLNANYPIYLLIGLIMFNFFRQATVLSVNVISSNSFFIKSIKVTQESLVISSILQALFSHFFEIILLIIFMIIFKVSLIGLIYYPFLLFFLLLFIIGISFILATIGVYIIDMENVWNVLTRLLWFLTPIFYITNPGTKLYLINLFNPMFYFIEITRGFILKSNIEFLMMALLIIGSILIFIIGILIFNKYKDYFAEMV
ncbi:ABC transporter permease [Candidatus Pacearchaeota archaeon]|nr:ABC transporter permease [Candidatus Pacearchaeota archaeon]